MIPYTLSDDTASVDLTAAETAGNSGAIDGVNVIHGDRFLVDIADLLSFSVTPPRRSPPLSSPPIATNPLGQPFPKGSYHEDVIQGLRFSNAIHPFLDFIQGCTGKP